MISWIEQIYFACWQWWDNIWFDGQSTLYLWQWFHCGTTAVLSQSFQGKFHSGKNDPKIEFFLYFEKFCYWFLLETDLNKNWYYSEFELMGRDLGFMTRFWMSMTKFFDIMNSFMITEISKTQWFYQWICDTQIMWKLFYVILLRIIVLSCTKNEVFH